MSTFLDFKLYNSAYADTNSYRQKIQCCRMCTVVVLSTRNKNSFWSSPARWPVRHTV